MTALPPQVRITEVGPRDGLQNESARVPLEIKLAFVRGLVAAGHTDIEVSSFVRPDVVPQLADAAALFEALGPSPEGVAYSALVPNAIGYDRARAAGADKIAVFTAATESFAKANINATIEGSLERFAPVVVNAKSDGVPVRGYISCAVRCPFEGPVDPTSVRALALRLLALGCDELSIGDTIGAATPGDVARLLDALLTEVPLETLVLHFHDTRGMAAANVLEALRFGVTRYDASAAGLGGCPFAPGASGNLATEDLVFLLNGLGVKHGVDLDLLRAASRAVAPAINHPLPSRVLQAPELPNPTPDPA